MWEGEPEQAIGLEAPLGSRAGSSGTDWRIVGKPAYRAEPEPHALYNVSKRLMDVALAALLLVVMAPLLLFACVAILVTARRNPLLIQTRTGYLGREFGMVKLRTMVAGDENAPPQVVVPGEILVAKTSDDRRVTRVGRVLRRTSLDELPQLINVIAGQMSIVGPRPGLPVEVAHYPLSWRRRLGVRPGLTGLWQVSGRSDVPAWRRAAMDRHYLRHRSLALDCAIVVRTVKAVLSMRGAW